jgi:uncharacterized protein (TIGR02117 family)
MSIRILLPVLLTSVVLCGCAAAVKDLYPPDDRQGYKTVYVVNHGLHTGIIVKRSDIPSALRPEADDFPKGEYIEFGWGDEKFYQAERVTMGMKFRAVFLPTSAVLHVVGIPTQPAEFYRGAEILEIDLSGQGFENLIHFIHESYERDSLGKSVAIGKGLQENSLFYEAEGIYFALNTCNNWVAKALRSSGFPITPLYAITTGNVMYQVRKHPGRVR